MHAHKPNRLGVIGSSDLNVHIALYPEATSQRMQTHTARHNHTARIHMANDKTINSLICVCARTPDIHVYTVNASAYVCMHRRMKCMFMHLSYCTEATL